MEKKGQQTKKKENKTYKMLKKGFADSCQITLVTFAGMTCYVYLVSIYSLNLF